MTRVKICGIRDNETYQLCADLNADFAGFVFYPPSPRNIEPDNAGSIIRNVEATHLKNVGIFVDPDDDFLRRTLGDIDLDYIQLHGDETVQRVREIKTTFQKPVIKAFKVRQETDLEGFDDYRDLADWLLFDAKPNAGEQPGGLGKKFDWSLLSGRAINVPWMLSGGLDQNNISEAITSLKPDAVDVSSGVEHAPGHKDPEKIKNFINTVKSND